MKMLFFSLAFLLLLNGYGQLNMYGVKPLTRKGVDSIHQLLLHEKTPKGHVDLLNTLARGSFNTGSIDSVFVYAQKALKEAEKVKYSRGEMEARSWLVRYHYQTGNYPLSLQLALHNLEKADQAKDTVALFGALLGVTRTYNESKDHQPSIRYLHRLNQLVRSGYYEENMEMKGRSFLVYNLLGIAYDGLNIQDSAFFYKKLAFETATFTKDNQNIALAAGNLAKYYAERDKRDSAFKYFNVQVHHAQKTGGFRKDLVIEAELGLGELFFKSGATDSAFYYARNAYQKCRQLKQTELEWRTTSFLNKVFAKQDKIDSAYKYLTLSVGLKDSLFNREKIKQQENVKFEEAMRIEKLQQENKEAVLRYQSNVRVFVLGAVLLGTIMIGIFLYRSGRNKQKVNAVLQAKNQEIQKTLTELKAMQTQLVQQEKMASLGELTAGIAHEIQNPLNFVNNFSDVNTELIEELKIELKADNKGEAISIANEIKDNEQKINHHGKRADAIVKGMLQHSRASTGKKELKDINALADEYLRLAYHGLRAKDKDFNATLKTNFDENIREIEVAPQDIGRALLNLYNNAFYAVNEKKKQLNGTFEPAVEVTTKRVGDKVQISVKDNGVGISQKLLDKIYHPFFTTKPAGQGTGLGLSLSYDIIKAHGGELKVDTKEGEGAEFTIQLPAT